MVELPTAGRRLPTLEKIRFGDFVLPFLMLCLQLGPKEEDFTDFVELVPRVEVKLQDLCELSTFGVQL